MELPRSNPDIQPSVSRQGWFQIRVSPRNLLATTLIGIVAAEVVAMIVVYYLRALPYPAQVLIDTAIMASIIYPLLYYLAFKPLLEQINQRKRSENILKTRLRLLQYASENSLDGLLQFILDEVEVMTRSKVGFFHFLEGDQKTLWLQAWSTNTLQNMCKAEGKDRHYSVDQAGVWADAVRQRKPVIHNSYRDLPDRKGMPEGHALVIREMVIPVLRNNDVVAIIGVGNKDTDYTVEDVEIVSTLADFAWDMIEHKRVETAHFQSEEKFRTLVEWTYDWEKWVDPQGSIVYISPSCERITGYTPEEFMADPSLLVQIVHPDDRQFYIDHQQIIHDERAGPMSVEYRIISRDGEEHWIEHICRPLYGKEEQYLGRRVSNRDITTRKRTEEENIHHTRNEIMLTQTIRTIQTDMARDLHDTLGQNIAYLRMNLDHLSAGEWSDPTYAIPQLRNMRNVANESYEVVRAMLAVLQADYSTNPLSLFTRYAEQVSERSAFEVKLSSQGSPRPLTAHQVRQLFYIFREALSNIEKYAQARHVVGEFLWDDHSLRLVICDDGVGFEPHSIQTAGHYGLKFMHDRAEGLKATFSIDSAPSKGTKVTVIVPFDEALAD